MAMNQKDSDRIHELCSLIELEQDREKFITLVTELNRILTAHDARLRSDGPEDLDDPDDG
jgi:hypothetical protein